MVKITYLFLTVHYKFSLPLKYLPSMRNKYFTITEKRVRCLSVQKICSVIMISYWINPTENILFSFMNFRFFFQEKRHSLYVQKRKFSAFWHISNKIFYFHGEKISFFRKWRNFHQSNHSSKSRLGHYLMQ